MCIFKYFIVYRVTAEVFFFRDMLKTMPDTLNIPLWTLKTLTGMMICRDVLYTVLALTQFKEFIGYSVLAYFSLLVWERLPSISVISLRSFTECSLLEFTGIRPDPANIPERNALLALFYSRNIWSFINSKTIYDKTYYPIQFNWVLLFSVFLKCILWLC